MIYIYIYLWDVTYYNHHQCIWIHVFLLVYFIFSDLESPEEQNNAYKIVRNDDKEMGTNLSIHGASNKIPVWFFSEQIAYYQRSKGLVGAKSGKVNGTGRSETCMKEGWIIEHSGATESAKHQSSRKWVKFSSWKSSTLGVINALNKCLGGSTVCQAHF